jgi:CRISPR-associated protein Cst2
MSLHVFASFVTPFGTAANNRGETDGNITTLQKVLWMGETFTTVSAEAIRFALRRQLALVGQMNRTWDEQSLRNVWEKGDFAYWAAGQSPFIDDDLLGFMSAEAGKQDGEGDEEAKGDDDKKKTRKRAGKATVRRAVLEVTRAVSLTPWTGETTFNAASPGATPSAAKKDEQEKRDTNPVPYGAEIHATRYQYGIALTPERLREKSRAAQAVQALCNLGPVAGNHGRFLFDFAPDSVVFRITDDPAPRILYCFGTDDDGKTVHLKALKSKMELGDIHHDEMIIGGSITLSNGNAKGVKHACEEAVTIINERLKIRG